MTNVTTLIAKHGNLNFQITQYIQYVFPLPTLSYQLHRQEIIFKVMEMLWQVQSTRIISSSCELTAGEFDWIKS
jgi:hypothetical protein